MQIVIDLGDGFDPKKVNLAILVRDAMDNFAHKRRDAERYVANGYKGGPPELSPEEREQWVARKVQEVETRVEIADEIMNRAHIRVVEDTPRLVAHRLMPGMHHDAQGRALHPISECIAQGCKDVEPVAPVDCGAHPF